MSITVNLTTVYVNFTAWILPTYTDATLRYSSTAAAAAPVLRTLRPAVSQPRLPWRVLNWRSSSCATHLRPQAAGSAACNAPKESQAHSVYGLVLACYTARNTLYISVARRVVTATILAVLRQLSGRLAVLRRGG